jgi:4-hydroxy-tetrahydrodipicolinate synthase
MLERNGNRPFTVVSSGHVSDSFKDQVEELRAIYESGTDALILITNRLDPNNEGDDVFIQNAEKIIAQLPEDAKLGLYECPWPYKRLVTEKILRWSVSTGRFRYMKDTCCDIDLIRERLEVLRGSDFLLFNANCQTLLESVRAGAAGYCGIMCNFHPQLYRWLCDNSETQPEAADRLQALLGTIGFTEGGMPYPLTAKYHMGLEGIPTENIARNRDSAELTEYMKDCTRQMKLLTDSAAAQLGI